MKIRKKADAARVADRFHELFKFDTPGQKNYLFVEEKETGLTLTIMKYPSGNFTINRRDDKLTTRDNHDGESHIEYNDVVDMIWVNRKNINEVLKLRGKC